MRPQRLGLAVEHDQRRLIHRPRRAELEHSLLDSALVSIIAIDLDTAVESDRRIAQRAVGDRDRSTVDDVVDDLMPDQDLDGVDPHRSAEIEDDHRFGVGEEVDVGRRGETRIVNGGDAIRRRSPLHDLEPIDEDLGEQFFVEVARWHRRVLDRTGLTGVPLELAGDGISVVEEGRRRARLT